MSDEVPELRMLSNAAPVVTSVAKTSDTETEVGCLSVCLHSDPFTATAHVARIRVYCSPRLGGQLLCPPKQLKYYHSPKGLGWILSVHCSTLTVQSVQCKSDVLLSVGWAGGVITTQSWQPTKTKRTALGDGTQEVRTGRRGRQTRGAKPAHTNPVWHPPPPPMPDRSLG